MAAIAAFNYLIPSAAIRGLAVVRTAARYGERLWSHEAALRALAGLRSALFARLAHADGRTAPAEARCLQQHEDAEPKHGDGLRGTEHPEPGKPQRMQHHISIRMGF